MIILVYVVEASGLNYPNQKIVATASLGRNVLETKVSSPRNTTRFDSSLAWKTDINSIKRMKSDNIPIKVECFCVGKTERELIGFVVVPLRTVSILTGNKVITITPKWHRLIGLRHAWKTLKPEILMFVTITDVVGVQIINEMRNTTSTATKNMLIPQQGIHIELNRKEQHIQIGSSSMDCHRFTIEIHWHHCEWLSYLTENPSSDVSFQMRYTLLDCPTEDRNLPKMLGASDIGRAFFKISSALPDTNDLNDFLQLTKDDTFVAINESFIYSTKTATSFIDEEHRPTLKYNLTLKYHCPSKENQVNQLPLRSHANEQTTKESHKYLKSENPTNVEHPKTHTLDDNEESKHVNDIALSTRRETVEQSIQRRNVFIQKLLSHGMVPPPPISPQKYETIRFVDVTSPRPQVSSEVHRQIDDDSFQTKIRKERFDDDSPIPVELDKIYCRSPKSVSFNPQSLKSRDEIMEWKTKQQEVFLSGLKQKENEHLKSLAEEWLNRQHKEEEKLAAKMKKCKLLTEALEHALSVCKEKNSISINHQRLDEAAHLERKKHSDEKISALSDQIRRTAIDHDYQLKLMELKLKEMEMKRKFTEDENEKLRKSTKKLEEENELLRGRSMELDAMTSRKLQSIELKLKHSQEMESFYKNKWHIAESKLKEIQTTKQDTFSQSNRHFSARVVDVLNSVRSEMETDKFELQSIKDMLE